MHICTSVRASTMSIGASSAVQNRLYSHRWGLLMGSTGKMPLHDETRTTMVEKATYVDWIEYS